MIGVNWYSLKHHAQAFVTAEPKTRNGFYTIHFPDIGAYRRYNANRILIEVSESQARTRHNVIKQDEYSAQIQATWDRRNLHWAKWKQAKGKTLSARQRKLLQTAANVERKDTASTKRKLGKLVGVVFLFEEGDGQE